MQSPMVLPTMEAMDAIESRMAGMSMSFLNDASSRPFCSMSLARSSFIDTSYADCSVYSPPPSPTRISSISRFSSPAFPSGSGTPSLMHESLSSTTFSLSMSQTPGQYTTTREPRAESISQIGLGICGLHLNDGSVFDGMGALPKRDESSEIGFFMDEADDASSWGDRSLYPEQEEDAWRKGIATRFDTDGLLLRMQQSAYVSPSIRRSPRGNRHHNELPPMMTPTLPSEPFADDVFYSHVPMSSTPRCGVSRKDSLGGSHAVVSSWCRNVQQAVSTD